MAHHHRHHKKPKSRSSHYRKGTPAPKSDDVKDFLRAVVRRVKRNGNKHWKKHRHTADKEVKELLSRFHLAGTNNENYWKLKAECVLIGKEVAYVR